MFRVPAVPEHRQLADRALPLAAGNPGIGQHDLAVLADTTAVVPTS